MAEMQPRPRIVRFEAFEADVETGELRKNGVKLKFSGQPFQVLAMLLERPGHVVTREELQKRLWPDTFVDVERNLNTAVNKIREVLGDSTDSPRFVETLPRRGYRFIGSIERPHSDELTVPSGGGSSAPLKTPHGNGILRYVLISLVVIVLLAFGAIAYRFMAHEHSRGETTVVLETSPFAAFTGAQKFPAFSPDGSRIAFAWNGEDGSVRKGFDLYVKAVGSETVLRLTHHPSELISSTWAPDGTQIAIHRVDGADTGIYIVQALGGPERKVRNTRIGAYQSSALQISWSPDGQWIAYGESRNSDTETRLFMLSTATWQSTRVKSPPECQQESSPSFSHNGRSIAFACYLGNNESGLFVWQLNSPEGRKVISFKGFVWGLAWSADDEAIVYSQSDTRAPSLREVSTRNRSVKQLVFEGNATFPTVSAAGHLAFLSSTSSYEIWGLDMHRKSPAVRLVPSSAWETDVDVSPDGKRIAFQSGRSGIAGIWISEIDGSNLVQLSSPGVRSGSPRWSPDGKKIAYDAIAAGAWEIYIADIDERIPRKLETNLPSAIRPHWSQDGKWIYFRSYDNQRGGIYRCPSSGGKPTRLVQDSDSFSPIEGLDSKSIYFTSHQWNSALKRTNLPLDGTVSAVDGIPPLRASNSWALGPDGIYYIAANHPDTLFRLDSSTGTAEQILKLDKEFGQGLSVSLDGKWVMFSAQEELSSNTMIADHMN